MILFLALLIAYIIGNFDWAWYAELICVACVYLIARPEFP